MRDQWTFLLLSSYISEPRIQHLLTAELLVVAPYKEVSANTRGASVIDLRVSHTPTQPRPRM